MQHLYYRELGENNAQGLVILHGLMGSSDNWLTLGKRFAGHFHVFILDQRNHGQSFHSDEFNYAAMASDLNRFLKERELASVHLLGHSMGGKVAMEFAINNPNCVEKLIVADIGPKSYPVHHRQILKGLYAIDLQSLKSRKEADDILSRYVAELGVRQFLLKNLTRTPRGFAWKFNLDAIDKNIEQVGLGLNHNYRYDKECLFIRGANSDYIHSSDANLIHSIFTDSRLETIEGAGHWLHAEKPEEFMSIVIPYLLSP